jgi:hypothetical protein
MGFVWTEANGDQIGAVNGALVGGYGNMGLSLLTGLQAVNELTLTQQTVWEWFTTYADHTPILIQTFSTAPVKTPQLQTGHVFTVMHAFYDSNNQPK